jgi:hypothetical protein
MMKFAEKHAGHKFTLPKNPHKPEEKPSGGEKIEVTPTVKTTQK